jgi:hypothetical protein
MATQKINSKSEFAKLIKQEVLKIKQLMESEQVSKTIDPLKVDMQQNDKLGDSASALVYKDPSKKQLKKGKESSEDPSKLKMNTESKDAGSDEKAATAVKVNASGKSEKGQAKANFTSKTENPKISASEPFDEKAKVDMTANDGKGDEDAPKTYVEAGAKKGGTDVTAGQAKAVAKEKAPDSKPADVITDWIQLKESYTKSELMSFIVSEAQKIAKKEIIKEELSKIKNRLTNN